MLPLLSGIVIGILLSILAVITGKKLTVEINSEGVSNPFRKPKMAKIIKNSDPIEEFLNESKATL